MSPTAFKEAPLILLGLPESECCLKHLMGVAPDEQIEAAWLCIESLSAPVIGQVFFRQTKGNQLTFSCIQMDLLEGL